MAFVGMSCWVAPGNTAEKKTTSYESSQMNGGSPEAPRTAVGAAIGSLGATLSALPRRQSRS
eukprot:5386874-Prymnesium_polylepis.2